MTRLLRSLIVAARRFAPLSFKGFRHSARLGRISPLGWSLLPGATALTRTGLPPARTTRLSGRTTHSVYNRGARCAFGGDARRKKLDARPEIGSMAYLRTMRYFTVYLVTRKWVVCG